jgi:4-hydroxy-tetrahydrodipicolinate synthase
MKETLVLLGIMDKAVVRPPLMKLSEKEINSLRQAISLSGL